MKSLGLQRGGTRFSVVSWRRRRQMGDTQQKWRRWCPLALALLAAAALSCFSGACVAAESMQTYLVRVKNGVEWNRTSSSRSWHTSLVAAACSSSASAAASSFGDRILYSYHHAFPGFAALLTDSEAAALAALDAVSALSRDAPVAQIHTTRTPSFLGLTDSSATSDGPLWSASSRGRNIIIGVIDTGAWPEHPSFSDAALSADSLPSSWNGSCDPSFPCNNKIIGARSFYAGYVAASGHPVNQSVDFSSPRDSQGHGTHTASTAAGVPVPSASFFGLANGTASGIAPLARLSIYKACWDNGQSCYDSDVLAAFDAAISDGVDVLSVSLGGSGPDAINFTQDSVAIGSFAAVARGIVVACSAGNSGPTLGSVNNAAPWILTVAANSVDREFYAPVTLGNGEVYDGASLYVGAAGAPTVGLATLIRARDVVVEGGDAANASMCLTASVLNSTLVRGKVVMCERGTGGNRVRKGLVVQEAGGVGMVLANAAQDGETLTAAAHLAAAAQVGFAEAAEIRQYINETAGAATARIDFNGTRLGVMAPEMAAFSSRGPNPAALDILKPDVTAPGINILAGWSGVSTPSGLAEDRRENVTFNVISGTSMSCPHVAGLTALLKAAHPTWSPAAIRSALMTTATVEDKTGQAIVDGATGVAADPTAYGAGHVMPNAALDPGLVYDLTTQDYVHFLCALNYTDALVQTFGSNYTCSNNPNPLLRPGDLNYPSFSITYKQSSQPSGFSATFSRTVTNVGPPNSTYTASVFDLHLFVNVSVSPPILSFDSVGQQLSYSVSFSAAPVNLTSQPYALAFGSLSWADTQNHTVRSPISFLWY